MEREIFKAPNKKIEIPSCYLDGNKNKYICSEICTADYAPYFLKGDIVVFNRDLSDENTSNMYLIEFDGRAELRYITLLDNDDEHIKAVGILQKNIPPVTLANGEYKKIGFPYMLIRKFTEGEKQCQP